MESRSVLITKMKWFVSQIKTTSPYEKIAENLI